MRMRRLLIAGATIAMIAAVPAVGAPDKTVPLSAATPEFSWDGVQGQYTNLEYSEEHCNKESDSYCELYLLDLRSDTPVTLDASLTEFSSFLADFDLRIYKSNAAGTFAEEDLIESHSFDPTDPGTPSWGGPSGVEEFVHIEGLPAGYYMMAISHYFNPNATYKGNVKVTGATGGAATPPPPSDDGGGDTGGGGTPPPSSGDSTPQPAQADAGPLPFKVPGTLGSARKAKKKKSLKFRGTATEAISNLTISLVDRKKKVVGKTRIASFPKGSKTIKLKAKRLKRGKYSLVSSGTVNGQDRVATQAVRIKK